MESTEYKSRLISELYSSRNKISIGEILEEMKDIGDDIFIGAIYDSFIGNKEDLLYEHVDALGYFKGKLRITYALKMLKEIPLEDAFEISCLYDIFEEENYYDDETIKIGFSLIEHASIGKESFYFIQGIVTYFRKIKQTKIIEDLLFSMLGKDSELDEDEKLKVLSAWIESDKEANFDKLIILPFSELGENFECILAHFIKIWKGPKIDKLKKKIQENGNIRSQAILRRNEERKKLENEIKKRTDEDMKISQFKENNAELIKEIIELRKNIDSIFFQKFSQKLFNPQEELTLEIFSPDSESDFQSSCLRLRDAFQDIESFSLKHNLSIEKQRELIPNCADANLNKAVNALYLFLKSKEIEVDSGIFGGRDFHKICTLGGSHIREHKKELITKLKKIGLDEFFIKTDFITLQFRLLNLYKEHLNKFKEVLQK